MAHVRDDTGHKLFAMLLLITDGCLSLLVFAFSSIELHLNISWSCALLALFGGLSIGIGIVCTLRAIKCKEAKIGVVTLIINFVCLIQTIFDWIVFKNNPGAQNLMGIIVSLFGFAIVMGGD